MTFQQVFIIFETLLNVLIMCVCIIEALLLQWRKGENMNINCW